MGICKFNKDFKNIKDLIDMGIKTLVRVFTLYPMQSHSEKWTR